MKKEDKRLLNDLYDRESRRVTKIEDFSTSPTITDYPDAKKHQIVSFIKSGIRIFGYILLPFSILAAASVLVVSEVIGIIEELV